MRETPAESFVYSHCVQRRRTCATARGSRTERRREIGSRIDLSRACVREGRSRRQRPRVFRVAERVSKVGEIGFDAATRTLKPNSARRFDRLIDPT